MEAQDPAVRHAWSTYLIEIPGPHPSVHRTTELDVPMSFSSAAITGPNCR